MQGIVKLNILQFSLIYLLLLVVLAVMKKSKINQTHLLITASIRMTVQLVLAGLILTYIFETPHPIFVVIYISAMIVFSIKRVLSKTKDINKNFKIAVSLSLAFSGLSVLIYFVYIVVGESVFNPQYTIPIAGMIIGNSMTGVTLALKTFTENIKSQRPKIDALLNMGATPKKILLPYVNNAIETALLPTLNSMLGMGIVSLPGMMTGQILSGTLPTTAIMYQIAIMIAICTSVCLTVFCSLNFGYKTLYNKRNQITY
jgi:putative ABC transport system permease protein